MNKRATGVVRRTTVILRGANLSAPDKEKTLGGNMAKLLRRRKS